MPQIDKDALSDSLPNYILNGPADLTSAFDALTRLLGISTQGITLQQTLDDLRRAQEAREDPTIPALNNINLQRFLTGTNQGTFDTNAILNGLPGTNNPFAGSAGITLGGDPSNPFNIPIQQPANPQQSSGLIDFLGSNSTDALTSIFNLLRIERPFLFDSAEDLGTGGQPNLSSILALLSENGGSGLPPANGGEPPRLPPITPPGPGASIGGEPTRQPPILPPELQRMLGGASNSRLPQPSSASPGSPVPLPVQNDSDDFFAKRSVMRKNSPVLDSFQRGTNFVPQTGNFQLHRGEAVIPANRNPANPRTMSSQGIRQSVAPGQGAGGFTPLPANLDLSGAQGTIPPPPPPPPPMDFTPLPANLDPRLTGGDTRQPGAVGDIQMPDLPPGGGGMPTPVGTGGTPTPVGTGGTPPNFLNMSLQGLADLFSSGGSFTPEVIAAMQAQGRDQASLGLQNNLRSLNEDFASRGLGSSGALPALELQARLGAQNQIASGNRDIASQAAVQNFADQFGVAGALNQGALGAGQFGLQSQALQQQFLDNMLQNILQGLNQAVANPNTIAAGTGGDGATA